ncbi:hypothetical protein QQ056_07325 [Oscillatoria laete-virens NRMC-F 0139]|nr:hypothetical protein [Oscillatoria laete-virens]MDL5053354.1 hypothetical protein [Oscillatoria laete-virens NRMC-F 0139]
MPLVTQIADAVTAELNGHAFSLPFTAERHYLPMFELPEMKTLHVTVVPKGLTVTQIARSKAAYDAQIDVAVQRKFDAGDATELDPLLNLVEEITEFFRFKMLPGPLRASWIKTEHPAIYAPEHMDQLRQFTSLLTFTFRVMR